MLVLSARNLIFGFSRYFLDIGLLHGVAMCAGGIFPLAVCKGVHLKIMQCSIFLPLFSVSIFSLCV